MSISTKLYHPFLAICALQLSGAALCFAPALAKGPDAYSPDRYERLEVRLDGRLDDEFWQSARPLTDWYRLTPNEGAVPSQKTTMWLAYDQEALYLAAKLEEDGLHNRVTRSLERDSYSSKEDGICLLLDTYNDDRTAFAFIVTPAGVRTDLAVFNDGEGRFRSWNSDWNAFWDAAVAQDVTGWTAEMRIPFSSLRFESHDGAVEMGLILWRYMAHNAEFNIFPAIPNRWQSPAYKPSQALDFNLRAISRRTPLFIKPFSLGGVSGQNLLRSDSSAYQFDKSWKRSVGVDVKYNLTSNLVLDATVNTDFAQVEVDDQRINTSRLSLFFPEKRNFFQERSDLFRYRFPGGSQRLFQSRRIGIVEGHNVPILGGLRLTGRVGAWDVGLIEMQTDKLLSDDEIFPAENFGVLRLQRQAFERGSFVGGLVTSRTDFNGNYNTVAAADCDIRVLGPQYLRVQLGRSFEPGTQGLRSQFATVHISRRLRRGLSFGYSFSHYGADFNPAVGFLNRPGINRLGSRTQYTWFPAASSRLQSHSLTNRASLVWNADSTNTIETFEEQLYWSALMKSGARISVSTRFTHEAIVDTFGVGDLEVLPGLYDFVFARARVESPPGYALRMELRGGAGAYFGGSEVNMEIAPSMTLSAHLALSLEYEYTRIKVRGRVYAPHLAKFRLRSAFNRALAINGFLQYNSSDNALSANVRLRYNPVEGSDFYLVYNEQVNTLLDPESVRLPNLPPTQSRSVLLKYSYTFID